MTNIDLTRKNVLVTGGAGFVGSNLVERAASAGAHIRILDDLFTGSLDNIDSSIEYDFVEGSVTDEQLVNKLVREADYVAHMAARNIIVSTKNPRNDYEVNIGGTLNVLMAAKEHGIKQIVYTSSTSIYGNPRYIPISEDERPITFSPYSVSKLAGENYCRAFYESYDLPVSVVRYSNIFGPKQDPRNPYCGVISKFIEAMEHNERPQIHGDGAQTRDFTYVSDAVDATLLAMVSAKAEGLAFNLGTGVETSILDLLSTLREVMGKDIAPEHIDRRDIDNIRRRVLNIELIRTRLRWQPQITLKEGLTRTVDWYRTARLNQPVDR